MDVRLIQQIPDLERLWIKTLMLILGERLGKAENEGICGVVVKVGKKRIKNRLFVWTMNGKDEGVTKGIGRGWKKRVAPGGSLSFKFHKERGNGGKQPIYKV